MARIQILSEAVANKIAAGEVIERPASIVKELVENALDAGAQSIEIDVHHGGKSLVRVADDGSGMACEDAAMALERHATSKISDLEDLTRIASFGFRGEALPSIAAVSRLMILTRQGSEAAGTEVVAQGGVVRSVEAASCRQGTVVEVRDLFFNTPARRKFLRRDSTELGHIVDAVSNLALARLGVRFSLRSSGRILLDLLGVERPIERAQSIFGEGSGKHLLEVDLEAEGIHVWGVIGKPYLARANRSGQLFFVNRRWVKAQSFGYALAEGYHGLLMHGQFAVAVLYVDLDTERVDVNVHPAKLEVRISHESEVRSLVKRAVAESLQRSGDLAPTLRVDVEAPPLFLRESVKGYPWGSAQGWDTFRAVHAAQAEGPRTAQAVLEPLSGSGPLEITKVLGQIHNTFIVAETQEGMVVLDGHAAHERVLFEDLVKNFRASRVEKQNLLVEAILEVGLRQQEILRESVELLSKVGFELEPFGENAFVVRAYPAVLRDEDPVAFLKAFLEEREDGKRETRLEQKPEAVAALVACKRKSVKAHEALPPRALAALVSRLSQAQNPFSCPHGRPTFFKLTFDDLEKQFKRK